MRTNLCRLGRPLSLVVAVVSAVAVVAAVAGPARAKAPARRYRVAAGIVVDVQTNLSWEQLALPSMYSWDDAQVHCASLDLGGTGWRLPTVKELLTIVDETMLSPALDPVFLPTTDPRYSADVANGRFWSTTTPSTNPSQAWTVSFSNGSTMPLVTKGVSYTRCVR